MPPIVLALVQGLFLLLLYLFVARAVKAVLRDVAPRPAAAPAAPRGGAPRGNVAGKRRPRTTARELVVHPPAGRPQVVRLDGHDITFGRAEGSTVVLRDSYASDHHARVFIDNDEWCVTDLGSTNGTFRNQVKVTSRTPIGAGDQLTMGKTVVEVRR